MNQGLTMCIAIRLANRGDYEAISALEEEVFIDPWLPEVIAYSCGRPDTTAIVIEFHGEFAGYAIYQLAGGDQAAIRVKRLAIKPEFRRMGLGGLLLDDLCGRLNLVRKTLIFPVRESNLQAQQWLKEYSIPCVEISEGYFHDGEAAYVFEAYYGE
jgi:ribosomal protein S18 acetylase RimI-like enzyme